MYKEYTNERINPSLVVPNKQMKEQINGREQIIYNK